jgi:hypothetical protein
MHVVLWHQSHGVWALCARRDSRDLRAEWVAWLPWIAVFGLSSLVFWVFPRRRRYNIKLIVPCVDSLSLFVEFGALTVPSHALYAEPAHCASFDATLANLIIDYEYESLGPLNGTRCF